MRRYLSILILLLHISTFAATSERNDSLRHQSVGLVLSGGGAKGIAHIGVIKALEDNDIPIDYVTGTSMGSIVGGLYAAGYTTDEMLNLILSEGFGYWSTGTMDPRLSFFFNRAKQTPAMFNIPLSLGDSTSSAVPQSLISPLPMNFAFMELFSPITAQIDGNFNNLMIPFRCVASDVAEKHKVVLSDGSLGDAIRASMSFPAVFQPTNINGTLLYDGGIYDNFPVDVMRRDFAPDIMIGVDVSTEETGPQTSILDQLSNMIIQNNDYSLPSSEGIKIRLDLNQFGLLDFPKARQIYKIGYDHTVAMIDSIKSRIYTRADSTSRILTRDIFKSKTPYLRFGNVTVTGGNKNQNAFIDYLFHRQALNRDTLTINEARRAYYIALSTDKLKDLTVHASYNDSTDLFDLNLKASVKNNFRLAFGGYLTSSNNSYLFLSAGYSTLSFNSIAANINAWIGQSDMAATFNGDIYLRTSTPSRLSLQAVISRRKFYEDDYMFYEARVPTFIIGHQYFGRITWSMAAGYLGRFDAGAGFGHLNDSFFRDNSIGSYETGRYNARHNLGQIYVSYQGSTLDDINFPTKGSEYFIKAAAMAGHFNLYLSDGHPSEESRPKWVQAEMRTRNYLQAGRRWSVGIESDIFVSTRKLYGCYNASIISAASYNPTPASNNTFNPAFRANNFIAAGIVPVYRYSDNLSARLNCSAFMPMRKIIECPDGSAQYGKWFSHPEFYGEFDITYHFPFATLAAYANYASYPARNWNVGISFGIYLHAPNFLR